MSEREVLVSLIRESWTELETRFPGALPRILEFYGHLASENRLQNLTRLISPADFVQGHLSDVRAVLDSGLVEFPAMDLGSGGGVPGLLSAVIRGDSWVLCESERRKAEFLRKTAAEMSLSHVRVEADRAERILKSGRCRVNSVVARAVGKVSKIYEWLRPCSTWNNIVLLKGPGWKEEWQEFIDSKRQGELKITGDFSYQVGSPVKSRVIVRLERVPRGTTAR